MIYCFHTMDIKVDSDSFITEDDHDVNGRSGDKR